ncbi:MAG: PHP domain-containing protein [Pseudomonadota bacterium]
MKKILDLHVHTHHSLCSNLNPCDIEKIALRRGLSAVAITDHNTLRGAREVLAHATTIKVIVAEEIRTNRGEIIGYFLKEKIQAGLSPEETIREIRMQEGLVSIPHPFDRLRSSRIEKDALEKILDRIDMIEVFNSRDILTNREQDLMEKAKQCGVLPVVSSDAHLKTEIGRSCIIIEDFTGPQDFLNKLKSAQQVSRKSPFWVHIVTKCIRAYKKASGSPFIVHKR